MTNPKQIEREAYGALRALMAERGSPMDMWHDLAVGLEETAVGLIARALTGPNYRDRDAALIYGSMIEQALETAIATHFVISDAERARFFAYADEDTAFPSFAAKTSLAYALGIYDERMRDDLKCIRNVRNAFAHARVSVDFETPAVVNACELLHARNIAMKGAGSLARQRYVSAAAVSAFYLATPPLDKPRRFNQSYSYEPIYKLPAT